MIISVGSINADFEMRVNQDPGTVETLLAHDMIRVSGGKAPNRAYIAKVMGIESLLLGRVGEDDLVNQALDPLKAIEVNVDDVQRAPGESTAVSFIVVNEKDGKKKITLANNANDGWKEASLAGLQNSLERNIWGLDGEKKGRTDKVIITLDLEISSEAALLVSRLNVENVVKILDPSPPDRFKEEYYKSFFAICANDEEASKIAGIDVKDGKSAQEAARKLNDKGIPLVCIKREDGGVVAVYNEGDKKILLQVPGILKKEEVKDTTGGGDAFTGSLAVAIHDGKTIRESVVFAVAGSHKAVTGYGSQSSYAKRREELVDYVKRLEEVAEETVL